MSNGDPMKVDKIPDNVEKRTDNAGNEYYVGNFGDFDIPPFPIPHDYKTHAKEIRELELRDDDILVCSMAKSGWHWHSQIINMLLQKSTEYKESFSRFIDPGVRYITKGESTRVFMTHVPFEAIPKQALEKKVKVLILTRNPKDVCVSFYSHMSSHLGMLNYPGTFADFFDAMINENIFYGNIFEWFMGMQKGFESNPDVPVMISNFEDMKEDSVRGVMKLNDFLGTDCSKELCEKIAEACEFSALKKVKMDNMPSQIKAIFKPGSSTFYRKGEVGDWKNWFTVAMNEHFDQECQKRMVGYKHQFRYTLD